MNLNKKNKYKRADQYCISLCFGAWNLNMFRPKNIHPLLLFRLPRSDATSFLNYTTLFKKIFFLIFPDFFFFFSLPPSVLVFSRFCPDELTLSSEQLGCYKWAWWDSFMPTYTEREGLRRDKQLSEVNHKVVIHQKSQRSYPLGTSCFCVSGLNLLLKMYRNFVSI